MIAERWSHGHSLGAGVLGGLLLSQHGWTIAVIAFALGVTVGMILHLIGRGASALETWTGRAARRTPAGPARPVLFDQESETYSRTPW